MEFPTVVSSSNDPLAAAQIQTPSHQLPLPNWDCAIVGDPESNHGWMRPEAAAKAKQYPFIYLHQPTPSLHPQSLKAVRRRLEPCERSEKSERHRNYQMLIACAFMVMAFQGALYPPGGVWEDDHANDPRAGTSKLSYTSPAIYIVFASANTLWFLSSTMLLGLLQMGLPMKNKLRASTFIVAVSSAVVVSGSWLVVLAKAVCLN